MGHMAWWLAGFVLLTGCGSDPVQEEEPCETGVGAISGNVYLGEAGATDPHVTLTDGGNITKTGGVAGGEFNFEVAPGAYQLSAEADGCTGDAIDVEVVACVSQFLDIVIDDCRQ